LHEITEKIEKPVSSGRYIAISKLDFIIPSHQRGKTKTGVAKS